MTPTRFKIVVSLCTFAVIAIYSGVMHYKGKWQNPVVYYLSNNHRELRPNKDPAKEAFLGRLGQEAHNSSHIEIHQTASGLKYGNQHINRSNIVATNAEMSHTSKATKVLIVSYFRGGSTLAGEVFNRNKNAFYWFEPLLAVREAFDRNKTFKGKTHLQEDDSRLITLSEPFIEAATDLIVQILNCQLEKVNMAVLRQPDVTTWQTSRKMNAYQACLHRHSNSAWSDTVIKRCRVEALDKVCRSSSIRAVKSIRVQLYMVPYLLKKDPDIHIIHYTRDPRGMLLSRNTLRHQDIKSTSASVLEEANEACATLMVDVSWQTKLQRRNIRFLTIRYEDLCVTTTSVLNTTYTFLGLETPPEVVRWFNKNTHANHSGSTMDTMRTNSTAVAYRWMQYLPSDILSEVTNVCLKVLEAFSYLPG